jgi:hypothetical protein
MDINRMYELLQANSQIELIKHFKECKEEISFNPTLQNVVNLLINEIHSGNIQSKEVIKDWLDDFYLLKHDRKKAFPSYIDFEKVIVSLLKFEDQSNIDVCKKYAKHFPNNPVCKPFLEEEKEELDNIVTFEPQFKKSNKVDVQKKPISLKKRLKSDILKKLEFQKSSNFKRTHIGSLYEMIKYINNEYKEAIFKECLIELKKKNKVYFANIGDIYSEIRLV